jgi:sulfate permease, SulP family
MRQPKIITTLQDYSWALFRADFVAGLTVAMVALPLSLAIAIASGAAPAAGLVTAVVAGFFISALGGSRVQIGGPTGAFIVVVYAAIANHGYDGLLLATLMAGVLLLVAGYFRAGSLMRFIPEAVINGFTIGIAIIIATSQLKDALGLAAQNVPAEFLGKIAVLWVARGSFNAWAFGLALTTIILIVLLRKLAPRAPGLLFAVTITSLAIVAFKLPVDTIQSRFGDLPQSLPMPSLPNLSVSRLTELLPTSITIAFLAGIESLLSAIVADRMIGGSHRPNAELTAQGVANLASSLFGGLPATGAIARTATNVRAGGRTPVAGIVHAIAVLLVMWFASPLASKLAMPAMAAVLILTAWSMSEPHRWKSYLLGPATDKALLLITLFLTVIVDLTIAVAVGTGLGLALALSKRGDQPKDWKPPERL